MNQPSILKLKITDQLTQLEREYFNISNHPETSSDEWMQYLHTYSSKSTEKSVEFRKAGNEYLRTGNVEDALLLYTDSIAAAPPRTVELMLSMANRSITLFQMENYVVCMQDINRVLKCDCPVDVRRELLTRKEACQKKIIEMNEKKSKILEEYTKNSSMPDNDDSSFMKKKLEHTVMDPETTEPLDELCSPSIVGPMNEFIPNASFKIKLCCDSIYGRHIMASEHIEAGEILVFENAFSRFLINDWTKTNCSHCFLKYDALIPCDGCSLVMYCGERCLKEAYEQYHRFECKIVGPWNNILKFNSMDSLAFRTTLVGTKQGHNLKETMSLTNLQDLFIKKEEHVEEKFQGDYNHVCNLERRLDGLDDLIQRDIVLKCAYMLYSLKCASFFGDLVLSPQFTEEERFMGLHLLNSYYVILCNPYAVYETLLDQDNFKMNTSVGIALYPFVSLVNHSCDPNSTYYFVKNQIVLYANQPIKAGEQVFTSYGPLFSTSSLSERRSMLRQYAFQCECNGCRMNWPLFADLPRTPKLLLNKNLPAVYEQLKDLMNKSIGILAIKKNLKVIKELLDFYRDFSTVIYNNFEKPWLHFTSCAHEIEKLMEMKGNLYTESSDINKNIEMFIEYALDTNIGQWFSDIK